MKNIYYQMDMLFVYFQGSERKWQDNFESHKISTKVAVTLF